MLVGQQDQMQAMVMAIGYYKQYRRQVNSQSWSQIDAAVGHLPPFSIFHSHARGFFALVPSLTLLRGDAGALWSIDEEDSTTSDRVEQAPQP